jgi:hypothetical protein
MKMVIVLSFLFLISCNTEVRVASGPIVENSATFTDKLNVEMGLREFSEVCNCMNLAEDGTWRTAKNPSEREGFIVIARVAHIGSVWNVTWITRALAIDIRNWNPNNSALDFLNQQLLDGNAFDNLDPKKPVDGSYRSDYYEDPVSGFRFEEGAGVSKDLEKVGYWNQLFYTKLASDLLVMEYGFSEGRATSVTNLISNFEHLRKSRKVSKEDLDYMVSEIGDINSKEVLEAITADPSSQETLMEDLIETAARKNGTTPEQMTKLFSDFLFRK